VEKRIINMMMILLSEECRMGACKHLTLMNLTDLTDMREDKGLKMKSKVMRWKSAVHCLGKVSRNEGRQRQARNRIEVAALSKGERRVNQPLATGRQVLLGKWRKPKPIEKMEMQILQKKRK
jgi:hypothetical protein